MRKAYAYLRVSGKSQVDGDGFPRQRNAVIDYARKNRIVIVQVFEERGVSGTVEDRPALTELLAALDKTIEVVIIEKLDRLARHLMVQETIMADFRKRGVELVSTMEPDLCSDDPSRELVRQMFGVIAQYEKSAVITRGTKVVYRIGGRNCRCTVTHAYHMEGQIIIHCLDDGMNYIVKPEDVTPLDW